MSNIVQNEPSTALIHEGWSHLKSQRPLAAWSCWQRALRFDPESKAALHALSTLETASDLPLAARTVYRLREAADPARRAAWNARMSGQDHQALDAMADLFGRLAIDDPRDSAAWYNRALCLAWAGMNLEAISCLDRVVTLDSEHAFDRAVEAWTLAEILRQGAGAETLADDLRFACTMTWKPADTARLLEESLEIVRVPTPRPPGAGDREGPEIDVYEWLDRPFPGTSELMTIAQGTPPIVLATVYISGQTLRLSSPRVENLERLEDVLFPRFEQAARSVQREATPLPLPFLDADLWIFRVPPQTDQSLVDQISREAVEHYFENQWIHRARHGLDGRSPLSAAHEAKNGDIAVRAKLTAVVRLREQLGNRPSTLLLYQGYPFDRLRRRLGLELMYPSAVDFQDVACASPDELDEFNPAALDDLRLVDVLLSALGLRDDARTARFATELFKRRPVALASLDLTAIVAPLVREAMARGDHHAAMSWLEAASSMSQGATTRTLGICAPRFTHGRCSRKRRPISTVGSSRPTQPARSWHSMLVRPCSTTVISTRPEACCSPRPRSPGAHSAPGSSGGRGSCSIARREQSIVLCRSAAPEWRPRNPAIAQEARCAASSCFEHAPDPRRDGWLDPLVGPRWSNLRQRQADVKPDLILHHGKIVTVDRDFSIRQAIAIQRGRLTQVGSNDEVLKTSGPNTTVIDLAGKMVLPGLIDSHTHPTDACMIEFDHPIPEMETIAEVLDYIRSRAKTLGPGKWVAVRQVFITRLKEQRYPTRDELDRVAPENPVLFATGPDASVNSLALKMSGIDRNFRIDGPGKIEKHPGTGEPTGILRNCTRYIKVTPTGHQPTEQDHTRQLVALFKDYNSVGLTGVIDRDAYAPAIDRYQKMHDADALTVRLAISHHIESSGPLDKILEAIRKVAAHPLRHESPWLRIIGIKTYLDGGMLTGSAYMREPWGVSKIYAIDDPSYRGVLFIPSERLVPMVDTAVTSGLQFTAHSVGDGAVHTLLDAYEEVNKRTTVARTRPCITHSNFMSRAAILQAAPLGVVVDIQPAWLFLDTRTLAAQFGYDRLRYFQPLRSLFDAGVTAGGGSDHMQKIGSLRSVNPYNPFLAMEIAITRRAKDYDRPLHPEEALSRAQAIRFYTINNAYLMFLENQVGSLEPGKLADFIVIDRDLLTCPEDQIKSTRVLSTYLDGKRIFQRPE